MQFTDIIADIEDLVLIMIFILYVGNRKRKE